jgi:hypothetical protein
MNMSRLSEQQFEQQEWEQWAHIIEQQRDDGQAWHQLMLERQQRVEEAFVRLVAGRATPQDIRLIADELGVMQPH